jgi:AcrR family transcriptional regulator
MENLDDLWPPFGPQAAGQADRAHRLLHERAEAHEARQRPGRDQQARGRGRITPTLSRAEIVDAAIAIADADGADAVSMRRIAQVLRSGTMSLYWHVANKQHLLDLMLDTLVGEITIAEQPADWRSFLQATARENRAMLLRHRWVMDFIGGRPPLGPNTILNVERMLAALEALHVDTATAMNILGTVSTYVTGAVLRELREMRAQRDLEQSGFDPAEAAAGRAEWHRRLRADGRFSHFLRIIEDHVDPDAEETRDERFEFGLDCVLDGIAMQVERQPGRSPAPEGTAAGEPAGPAEQPAGAE